MLHFFSHCYIINPLKYGIMTGQAWATSVENNMTLLKKLIIGKRILMGFALTLLFFVAAVAASVIRTDKLIDAEKLLASKYRQLENLENLRIMNAELATKPTHSTPTPPAKKIEIKKKKPAAPAVLAKPKSQSKIQLPAKPESEEDFFAADEGGFEEF